MRDVNLIKRDLASAKEQVAAATDNEVLKKAIAEYDALSEEKVLAERQIEIDSRKLETTPSDVKANKAFSIFKAIKAVAASRPLDGAEADVNAKGLQELKDAGVDTKSLDGHLILSTDYLSSTTTKDINAVNYTTNAEGGYLTVKQPPRYIDALRQRMVLTRHGATLLGNLVGTIPFVTDSMLAGGWVLEGAAPAFSKPTFTAKSMMPHCYEVITGVTKDELRQTSIDVEAKLLQNIIDANAAAIESAAFAGSGVAPEPLGILNTDGIGSVAMGTDGAAITFAKVVALETAVNVANGNKGNLAYITNGKVNGSLKTTPKVASTDSRMILDDVTKDILNGYAYDWTNLVPSNLTKGNATTCSAMIFGDWSQLYIGNWGGIDISINPYINDDERIIRLTIASWSDILTARPQCFAAIKDILA